MADKKTQLKITLNLDKDYGLAGGEQVDDGGEEGDQVEAVAEAVASVVAAV